MPNYLLLCHGSPIEFSSFDVPETCEVVYWGAPGFFLPADVAWTAVAQIRMNPTDLRSIARYFHALPDLDDRILSGGHTYRPDLFLTGDDLLLCWTPVGPFDSVNSSNQRSILCCIFFVVPVRTVIPTSVSSKVWLR